MFRVVLALSLVITIAGAVPRVRPIIPKLDGRIVGGTETTIEQRPYQLSLQYFESHICGASIISETVALTAAHCTEGTFPFLLTVRAGSTRHDEGGQISQVAAVYPHPEYNSKTADYDVCVVMLENPLVFNLVVHPIHLGNVGEDVPDGALATVSGWGSRFSQGPVVYKLRTVVVSKINDETCQKAYDPSVISQRMFCFGFPEGGKDSCQGDSGGPLVFNDNRQVGIVSWGYGCARPQYPGVYTRITNEEIYRYINSTISNNQLLIVS